MFVRLAYLFYLWLYGVCVLVANLVAIIAVLFAGGFILNFIIFGRFTL